MYGSLCHVVHLFGCCAHGILSQHVVVVHLQNLYIEYAGQTHMHIQIARHSVLYMCNAHAHVHQENFTSVLLYVHMYIITSAWPME